MKKYQMNKDVVHDGKKYSKGDEIKDGDPGFKSLVDAGHAVEFNFKDEAKAAEPEAASSEPVFADDEESGGKKKKGHR